jgi:hypothetical protein
MNDTDWAVVVGVQFYLGKGFSDLAGPRNDAEAFKQWLIDPQGGGLREDHVKLVVSPSNRPGSLDDAEPTVQKVLKAFEAIQEQAVFNLDRRRSMVGRRLYLYFAGHGYAPRTDQTALFMADATERHIGPNYHWLADYTADWFYHAGYFDEILLFIDCCRERFDLPSVNIPWKEEFAADFRSVRRFYAYATGWTLLSREQPDDNGVMRGVFTRALIDGLRGRAVESAGSRITTASLKRYLMDSVRQDGNSILMDSDFIADDFPVAALAGAPEVFPVNIKIPAAAAGRQVQVKDARAALLESKLAAGGEVWRVQLGKGLYKALVPDLSLTKLFEVSGAGDPDVEFS